jgi:hypothetical protein
MAGGHGAADRGRVRGHRGTRPRHAERDPSGDGGQRDAASDPDTDSSPGRDTDCDTGYNTGCNGPYVRSYDSAAAERRTSASCADLGATTATTATAATRGTDATDAGTRSRHALDGHRPVHLRERHRCSGWLDGCLGQR